MLAFLTPPRECASALEGVRGFGCREKPGGRRRAGGSASLAYGIGSRQAGGCLCPDTARRPVGARLLCGRRSRAEPESRRHWEGGVCSQRVWAPGPRPERAPGVRLADARNHAKAILPVRGLLTEIALGVDVEGR